MAGASGTVIGSITGLSGGGASSVCVQGVDVIERALQPNAELRADETLRVPEGARMTIALVDGTEVILEGKGQGHGREIALDRAGIDQLRQETAALESSADDVDDLQAALLAGADPSQLEATAAGPGNGPGNEGGTSFVRINRNGGRGRIDPSDLDTAAAGEPEFPGLGQSEVLVPPGLAPTFVPPGPPGEEPEPPPQPPEPPEPPVTEPPETTRNPEAVISTNSSNIAQVALFTFAQGENSFWTLLNLDAQGGSNSINEQWNDVGFDIDLAGTAETSLAWVSSDPKGNIQVNEFSVGGVVIQDTRVHTVLNDEGDTVNKPKLVDSNADSINSSQGDVISASLNFENGTVEAASISFPRHTDDDSAGSSGDENLVGSAGNDLLVASGDFDFSADSIEAGDGIDILAVHHKYGVIDLGDAAFENSQLEIINLVIDPNSSDGDTANTLRLDANDILDLGSSDSEVHQLYVVGDEDDQVQLKDAGSWERIAGDTDTDGWIGYTQSVGNEVVNLYIQTGISVVDATET